MSNPRRSDDTAGIPCSPGNALERIVFVGSFGAYDIRCRAVVGYGHNVVRRRTNRCSDIRRRVALLSQE